MTDHQEDDGAFDPVVVPLGLRPVPVQVSEAELRRDRMVRWLGASIAITALAITLIISYVGLIQARRGSEGQTKALAQALDCRAVITRRLSIAQAEVTKAAGRLQTADVLTHDTAAQVAAAKQIQDWTAELDAALSDVHRMDAICGLATDKPPPVGEPASVPVTSSG